MSLRGAAAAFVSAASAVRGSWGQPRYALSGLRRAQSSALTSTSTAVKTTMIRGFPNGFGIDPTSDVPVDTPAQPKRALDELVDFPCVFTFKVVGVREVSSFISSPDSYFFSDLCSAAALAEFSLLTTVAMR
jgi:hypothetical protein